jgi:nucleotide-binding universal stress UspA family protein
MSGIIIVPLDGSAVAESILPAVEQVARLSDNAVQLVHVVDMAGSESAAQQYLDSVAARLSGSGAIVTTSLLAGHPAEAIIQAGGAADMIAMATHGRSGIGRWVHGSVADKVLRGATVPVLLVRANAAGPVVSPSFKTLVVPLDGSPLAEQALPLACTIAKAAGAGLVVIESVYISEVGIAGGFPGDYGALMSAELAIQTARDGATEYLNDVVGRLHAEGLTATPIISLTPPADAILDAAEQHQAGLIVMSTHGRGGVGRWVFGSVADRVLRAATIPVLLVRATESPAPSAAAP